MPSALSVWESGVLLWFQNFIRNDFTDPIVSFLTHLGDHGWFFILLTLLLLAFPKTRRIGLATGLGLLCSLLFTNIILKNLIQRPRPWVSFPAIAPLVNEPDPNSFPSGHTSAAFAFALAYVRAGSKRWSKVAVVVLAALMGLSRLYVGVHYPSDVLAGFAVGDLAGLTGWYLSVKLMQQYQNKNHPVK